MADEDGRAIAAMHARLDNIEAEMMRLRDEQAAIRTEHNRSVLESSNMCKDLEWITDTLKRMSEKKIRTVDIFILIISLIIGATSAYAAVQNNQLTKTMIQMSQSIKGGTP